MANKAYSSDFRMYMEGVRVPFKSAMITCTPNGVEANINITPNKEAYNILPKTAVQIFYRDWIQYKGKKPEWKLMFDGFFSSYFKQDGAQEGRALGIVCRDFRMDMRKAPAALAWESANELSAMQYYHTAGIFHTWVVPGVTPTASELRSTDERIQKTATEKAEKANKAAIAAEQEAIEIKKLADKGLDLVYQKQESRPQPAEPTEPTEAKRATAKQTSTAKPKTTGGSRGEQIYVYGNSGLNDVGSMIGLIAGTAYGKGLHRQKDGEYIYTSKFGTISEDKQGQASGALFLDSVVRGMWMQATGGTAIGAFINRRTRVDKRFMIPRNNAGFRFWSSQAIGLNVGNIMMSNSRFSSIEAAILRLAGLFAVRVYSCSTPSFVSLDGDAAKWVMDPDVKNFMVNRASAEFGAKYILNETMLIPPTEFTSPPNCNLIFPPMYNNIQWQYDIDADITRGYFKQVDMLNTSNSKDGLKGASVQIPNALFNIRKKDADKKERFKRVKPPLTLEERYKGVSVYHGSVEYGLAADDTSAGFLNYHLKPAAAKRVKAKAKKVEDEAEQNKGKDVTVNVMKNMGSSSFEIAEVVAKREVKKAEKSKDQTEKVEKDQSSTTDAMRRHALIKFLNMKYAGRVAIVDMHFNPYIMCGFPGVALADEEASGAESMRSIIGQVQQVKHVVNISNAGADATTSVVLNNARFTDESTDMDEWGSPLYMKATNKSSAEFDIEKMDYTGQYFVPEPKAPVERDLNDAAYDLNERKMSPDYIYAKDLLTLTAKDVARGERNRIYLDEEYAPNRIAKFYTDVFVHKNLHFMIDEHVVEKETKYFMYDTVDEAVRSLRTRKGGVLYKNYEDAMKFIRRHVCNIDEFFQGVLGLSIPVKERVDGKVTEVYRNYIKDFDGSREFNEYFGITTDMWDDDDRVQKLKLSKNKLGKPKDKSGKMTEAGQFSSIYEHIPLTAFIQERKDVVLRYKAEAIKRAQGVQIVNSDR